MLAAVAIGLGGGLPAAATAQEPAEPAAPRVETPAEVVQPPETAPPVRLVEPPADPAAALAFGVLEKHCSRCHQGGRLKRPSPASSFGNILRLDEIARDPSLVRPGNPDASRLYTHVLRRLMPYDVHQEQAAGPEPTPDEINALRTWIARLQPVPACRERRLVTLEMQAEALRRVAESAGAAAGRLRFVSLAHLYNGCAGPEAMYGYRQGVLRLFNSLSWKPGPVRVAAVDEARTLLKIDLEDLGWVPAHWDRIMRSGLNGPGNLALLPKAATEPFGTGQPVVRGDWLADTVLRTPLYYDLLGLPGLAGEITRILQLDPDALRRAGGAQRGIVRAPEFTRSARLVERLGVRNRALWTAYDAVHREGRRDIPDAAALPASPLPPHDATMSMFLLPNGLPAFYIASLRGDRVDQVPADIARRSIAARTGVRAGLDCLGCHAQGPVTPSAASDIGRAAARDRELVHEGLSAAGIEPGYMIDGVEPAVALARQFMRPVSLERAAVELGVDAAELAERLAAGPAPAKSAGRRLLHGLVGRGELETEFRELLSLVGTPLPGGDGAAPLVPPLDLADPGPGLVLLSDKPAYKVGDTLSLTVRATADCHLTLIGIDQRGRGTVIYPSDFEPNNLIGADRELRLPAEGAPYLFRLKERGRESIVAVCSTAASTIDGIVHDFERQRFTDLGDYGAFLMQALAARAGERRPASPSAAAAPASPAADPKAKGRRRPPPQSAPAEVKGPPDRITHTAITIEVR
jgi:hypothetical protein